MKSILEIKLQVKENDPNITDEELRLCVESLDNITHFYKRALVVLIDAIRQKEAEHRLKFKAEMAWETIEQMATTLTKTPQEWLGPNNIPGTEIQQQRLKSANALYRKTIKETLRLKAVRLKAIKQIRSKDIQKREEELGDE